jgi:hypothetical protein
VRRDPSRSHTLVRVEAIWGFSPLATPETDISRQAGHFLPQAQSRGTLVLRTRPPTRPARDEPRWTCLGRRIPPGPSYRPRKTKIFFGDRRFTSPVLTKPSQTNGSGPPSDSGAVNPARKKRGTLCARVAMSLSMIVYSRPTSDSVIFGYHPRPELSGRLRMRRKGASATNWPTDSRVFAK